MAVDLAPTNSPDTSDAGAPNIGGPPAGLPTSPPPTMGGPAQPQPDAPPKETFRQGMARGAAGPQFLVDGQGNVVSARTTADSGPGNFGSILSGVIMGALAGAKTSRSGRVPSQEARGGFGAGVAAATEDQQQREQANRQKAQVNFANRQATAKMSREQAESAATLNHLAADTARTVQETKFASDEHPLHVAALQAGLDETTGNIKRNAQELMTNSMKIAETLGEAGIDPKAIVSTWKDAQGHAQDIVQGRSLPLYNGQKGDDAGVGMYDPQTLKNTMLTKPVTFNTYTSDRNGNPIAKENTLPAGTSAFAYVMAAMSGSGQLQRINSQQRIQQAADLNRADIKQKNASAFRDTAEAEKARADTVGMKDAIQGQAEDLVESNMDPSQIQKRGNQYTPILAAAREYSLKKYGQPFDLAKAQEDYKFASDPKTQNKLKYMNSLVGDERTGSTGNLDLLVQYSDKLKRTDFPALNNAAAWARLESGDTNIIKFHNAAVDAADQFANIMAGGGSGNATSDAKIKQGLALFDKGFSKDQIRASASSVKDMLANRKREFIGDNRYLKKQYAANSASATTNQSKPNAVSQGIPRPSAATMTVKGSDGKLHWSDGKSDLGIAQ